MSTQPRTGYRNTLDHDQPKAAAKKLWSRRGCPSGKKPYTTEWRALNALVAVRVDRDADQDPRDWESSVYECRDCAKWHLTSKEALHPNDLTEPTPGDDEPWESYAHRLERRIKEQRVQILSLHAIGHGAQNRQGRKKVAHLTVALGRMTERWEQERRARIALARKLRRHSLPCLYRLVVGSAMGIAIGAALVDVFA